MDKLSFLFMNLFINSVLAFGTAWLLIEGLIRLFRIKEGRVTSTLRMIPILKLPLDLFFYNFSTWSYLADVNPLLLEPGTRTLTARLSWPIVSKIVFFTDEQLTFSLADLFAYSLSPIILKSSLVVWLVITALQIIRGGIRFSKAKRALAKSLFTAENCNRSITNEKLRAVLEKKKIRIKRIEADSPFVAGFFKPVIYIPKSLESGLTDAEYEAIIMHEVEHAIKFDNLFRLCINAVRAVFWWVPTARVMEKISHGWEISCDGACKKYGANPLDLAAAITLSAKESKTSIKEGLVQHLSKSTIIIRLERLLEKEQQRGRYFPITIGLIFIGAYVVLAGKFWLF